MNNDAPDNNAESAQREARQRLDRILRSTSTDYVPLPVQLAPEVREGMCDILVESMSERQSRTLVDKISAKLIKHRDDPIAREIFSVLFAIATHKMGDENAIFNAQQTVIAPALVDWLDEEIKMTGKTLVSPEWIYHKIQNAPPPATLDGINQRWSDIEEGIVLAADDARMPEARSELRSNLQIELQKIQKTVDELSKESRSPREKIQVDMLLKRRAEGRTQSAPNL